MLRALVTGIDEVATDDRAHPLTTTVALSLQYFVHPRRNTHAHQRCLGFTLAGLFEILFVGIPCRHMQSPLVNRYFVLRS